jgi:hypothetical protein
MLVSLARIAAILGAVTFHLYLTGLIVAWLFNLTHKERRNVNDPEREEYVRETPYTEITFDCIKVGLVANIPLITIVLLF